jgi:hypothetical protein
MRKRPINRAIARSGNGHCAGLCAIAFVFRQLCRSLQGICRLALVGLYALDVSLTSWA